ncbi:MAG: SPOR domain-containing protein [Alkalispirochaeta sp.]
MVAYLVVLGTPVSAQTVDTYDDAVAWLDSNPDSPQYGTMLETAIEYAPTVDAVQALLDDYLPGVMDRSDRGQILLHAGIIQELAHQYNAARVSYARAVDANPTLWDASLRRSALAIEEGDLSEAELLLTQAIHQAPTRQLQRRAAILRVRVYLMQDRIEQAFSHAASLVGYPADGEDQDPPDVQDPPNLTATVEPEALLLLYEAAQSAGDEVAQEWSQAAMAGSFARDVPESSLARDGLSPDSIATYYPSPSRIFGGIERRTTPIVEQREEPSDGSDASTPRSSGASQESASTGADTDTGTGTGTDDTSASDDRQNAVIGIQTGSFRDRENAQYMARDIRELDFPAEVQEVQVNNDTFFRVIVPLEDATPESAQETVVRLKEEGVEGFLIFESP